MTMGRWRRNSGAASRRLKRAHTVAPAASGVFRSHPVKQVRRPHSNGSLPSMFSREGGSPVWVPAFAGKHACGAFSELVRSPSNATPAKAGAQLGDVANGWQRVVIATFPIGPRPPPG